MTTLANSQITIIRGVATATVSDSKATIIGDDYLEADAAGIFDGNVNTTGVSDTLIVLRSTDGLKRSTYAVKFTASVDSHKVSRWTDPKLIEIVAIA